jgi:integrase
MGRRPGFGSIEKLASGRFRARYPGPDGRRHTAPVTFVTKSEARGWLSLQHAEITRTVWAPPESIPRAVVTFGGYAEQWLSQRELKDRTREHYRMLLDKHLLPAFGAMALTAITADHVKAWHAGFGKATPTLRSHCYGLLRTLLGSAVADGKAPANPCVIRGAASTKRVHRIRPAALPELEKITTTMPAQYQAMILLAAWCALRFGELTELRRKDIELDADQGRGVIRIRRAVVRTEDGFQVTTPKSDAGVRDVAIPPHLVGATQEHMAVHVGTGPDALLFPAQHGGHLAPATLYRRYYTAP